MKNKKTLKVFLYIDQDTKLYQGCTIILDSCSLLQTNSTVCFLLLISLQENTACTCVFVY